MSNKLKAICGALFFVVFFCLALIIQLDKFWHVATLLNNEIQISYSIGYIPIITWFLLLSLIAFFYYPIGSQRVSNGRFWFKTFPLILVSFSILFSIMATKLMKERLLSNGYKLEYTIEASAPWRFDTDVYIKVKG